MSYSSLSTEMQNIVMTNFEFFGKFALIVGLFVSCFIFVSNFNKREKSPYFAVRYIKGIMFICSKVFMFMFPLTIFLMYPQVSIDTILIILVSAYSVMFAILGFVIIPINVLLFGSAFISDFLDIPLKGKEVRKDVYQIIGQGVKK